MGKVLTTLSWLLVITVVLIGNLHPICGFVGCASHPFNLAVIEYIDTHGDKTEESICTVHAIMKKLWTIQTSAKLRIIQNLKNVTRWISTFNMLQRYTENQKYFR